MGVSEMVFVGGFTVICLVATVSVSVVSWRTMQENVEKAKERGDYWREKADSEEMLRLRWNMQSDEWKKKYISEKNTNDKLRRHIAELQRSRQAQPTSAPNFAGEEKTIMVKALKKAMFDAHPDRGGKQDDFIKINQLYKKLK